MNQLKAFFNSGHQTNGIFILRSIYGRKHVSLRNVVFLEQDILIRRKNWVHFECLTYCTCGSV